MFHGIPEAASENCEEVLQVFLREKLMLHERVEFERVHRMGRPRMEPSRPRPIVAMFARHKDRELVRVKAKETLYGQSFSVN